MSTKMTKLVLAIGAMVMAGGAMAAVGSGTASATIVNPITVAEDAAHKLSFGTVTGAVAGTVILSALPTTVVTGTLAATTAGSSSGKFDVTGGDTNSYTIAVSSPVTLTSTSELDSGTMSAALVTDENSKSLTGGVGVFYVGGTLTVGLNQNAGAYSGSYTVTVNYQ